MSTPSNLTHLSVASPYYSEILDDESSGDSLLTANLGTYVCNFITNIPANSNNNDPSNSRTYFDFGLRYFYSFQHEDAYKCFLACLRLSPDCAFAHGMAALCHCPNYNFKGIAYYESTDHPDISFELDSDDVELRHHTFPCQQVAARHSLLAVEKIDELKLRRTLTVSKLNNQESEAELVSNLETDILTAIRVLTCRPGINPSQAEDIVGRPYSDALRKVHEKFPGDAEVSYLFAESLMILNAWNLYEYPTGKPLSIDIPEIESVLEKTLELHPDHAGLCHLYVHLCEMSGLPEKALPACEVLRTKFPDAGHLIHMPTHIDVLLGHYESCVRYNYSAILSDERKMRSSPETAGTGSFYFGYIVHNFHMLVYGCIMGGMESIAMETALRLHTYLNEDLFLTNPDLAIYLESYSALDIHVMVRFGRWQKILQTDFPRFPSLMLFRSATLHFARGLAFTNTGQIEMAISEADKFDEFRLIPTTKMRILHNNTVDELLSVDHPMLRGEIAYQCGSYEESFSLLRSAVSLQDGLHFDEPWGKMQPIRHALGGLLCEQGYYYEAEKVFRADLKFHPMNPWALVGIICCLRQRLNISEGSCCGNNKTSKSKICGIRSKDTCVLGEERINMVLEVEKYESMLSEQRKSTWADYDINVSCLCCRKSQKRRIET